MKAKIKFLSLILALVMIFCSCDQLFGESNETEAPTVEETDPAVVESEAPSSQPEEEETQKPNYRQSISRSRAEIEEMLTLTDDAFTDADAKLKAFEELAVSSDDVDAIDALYLEFEDAYDYISTQVSISSIIYYINMSNTAAYDRYNGFYDKYGDLYNAYIESCKNIYQNSPVRDELFADWTEEEINQMLNYSPESQELSLKNDELLNELNNLGSDEFKDRSAEIYAELVTNNNRIAELAGYDNYYDYATKEIYLRDYGSEELEKFCAVVAEKYVPEYGSLYNNYSSSMRSLETKLYNNTLSYLNDAFDRLDKNYLEAYIESLDGSMKEGMQHVFVNRNMVFSNAINSHPSAFQTYLDDLEMPFCLFGRQGQSTSTLVHEFGHYYASLHQPDLSSYDLAEVQSQGNEMLLLNFIKDEFPADMYEAIKAYNMYSNMTTIISCVVIDEFEREVYALESVEGYGSAEFDAILEKVCAKYGGMAFLSENMGDMYNYWRQVATNNPVYYISYAISLTGALNIYAEVENDRAAGREMYRMIVEEVAEDGGFLSTLEKAGLASPFSDESTENVISVVWGEKEE